MRHFFVRFLEIFRPFKRTIAGILGFLLVSRILGLIMPLFFGKMLDALNSGKSFRSAYILAGIIFGASFSAVAVKWLQSDFEIKFFTYPVHGHMRNITLRKFFSFSVSQYTSQNSGKELTILDQGERAVVQMATTIIYQGVYTVMEVILITAALFFVKFPIGLVVLVGMICFISRMAYLNVKFAKEFLNLTEMENQNGSFRTEIIRSASSVAFNAQEYRMIDEYQQMYRTAQKRSQDIQRRLLNSTVWQDVIVIISLLMPLLLSMHYVEIHALTTGQLVMIYSWAAMAISGAANITSIQRQAMGLYGPIKKYFDMLDAESNVKIASNPIIPEKFLGRIEFRNVTLRYPRDIEALSVKDSLATPAHESHPALDNVSFVIVPGEKVAIVGESGAGKSTLVRALMRAQDPDDGEILIDGYSLRDLDLPHFRQTAIGLVEQEVRLFDKSLRYNLTFPANGRGSSITNKELMAVATTARLESLLTETEQGFDRVLGENGKKISGGQRQRVAIGRALLKEPPILIFDEATSNIDSWNEGLIKDAIEEVSVGRTVLIIAHRFSMIRSVDRIIVMDQGRIVGQGTHASLFATCVLYRRLVKTQLELLEAKI